MNTSSNAGTVAGNFTLYPESDIHTLLMNDGNATLTMQFTLQINDSLSQNGRFCKDSIFMDVVLLDNSKYANDSEKYGVGITALKSIINANERLRLLGQVFDSDGLEISGIEQFTFVWNELTGLRCFIQFFFFGLFLTLLCGVCVCVCVFTVFCMFSLVFQLHVWCLNDHVFCGHTCDCCFGVQSICGCVRCVRYCVSLFLIDSIQFIPKLPMVVTSVLK